MYSLYWFTFYDFTAYILATKLSLNPVPNNFLVNGKYTTGCVQQVRHFCATSGIFISEKLQQND